MPLPDGSAPADLTRWRWLGFGGALLLAVGAAGAGVLPRPDDLGDLPVVRTLRTDTGVTVSIVLAALGMALLVGSWWALRRADAFTPRWITTTAALWSLPLVVAPPLFSRDVYSYAAQGDLLAHGLNPYDDGPAALPSQWLESISPTWYDTAAPYGPLFLQLARFAVALCGGQLPVAVLLLRVIALVGVALVAFYLPRLARACGVPASTALWLGLASPLLIAHFVSGAHNDALMVGLLVAGLAYAAERRGYPAAVLLALAVAVKAPAAVALPFAVLLWSARWPGRSRHSPGRGPDRVGRRRHVRRGHGRHRARVRLGERRGEHPGRRACSGPRCRPAGASRPAGWPADSASRTRWTPASRWPARPARCSCSRC